MPSIKNRKQNRDQSGSARERIIKTASGLFESQGYAATGINQIIANAETAKASFYDHFESKELLGQAYLARYGEHHLVLIRTLMARAESPADFMASWVRILKRQLRLRKFYGCPMSNLRAQTGTAAPLLTKSVKVLAEKTIETIAGYLEEKIGGKFSDGKMAALAARRIFAAYEGAIHIWQLTGDESALDDIEFFAAKILK